ncbi:MAG: DUF2452 domain-containing protein, partial [Leadbetterella sp.]
DQLQKLYKQIELLHKQATDIGNRIDVSERIYDADMSFEPIINQSYYLYEKSNGKDMLSMVAPNEWGRKFPFTRFLAHVFLLADHTWHVEYYNEEEPDFYL